MHGAGMYNVLAPLPGYERILHMLKVKTFLTKALSCVCALTVAFSMTSAGAIASAYAQGTDSDGIAVAAQTPYECNNGWKLNYSVFSSKVCITGVASTGSGALTIPSKIDGMPVTVIGPAAFKDCAALSSVELPSSITTFKQEAFCGSGLVKISIPASVTALSYRCFKSCTKLTSITFQGDSMLYLGQEAFMYCSALKTLELPYLTSYPVISSTADDPSTTGVEPFAQTCAIGMSCLAQCTSLETVIFNGVVGHETPDYFLDVSCLNGSEKISTFVWKCKSDSVGSGQSGQKVQAILESYYSLDFYNSESDAKAYKNKIATVTYEPKKGSDTYSSVKTLSLINGTEDYSKYKWSGCSESVPNAPSGKVWGVADNGVLGDWDTLDDSYQVIAVDKDNLDYGWVETPEIRQFYADCERSSGASSMYDSGLPILYAEEDGSVPDIESGLKVCAADGSTLSGDNIKFEFQQAEMQKSSTGMSENVVGWHDVDKVNGAGRYTVKAVNTKNDTETPTVTFTVADFEPDVHAYTNATPVSALGSISSDIASELSSTPEYNVVTSCSSWQSQLVAAGLAGASGGLLLFDDAANTSTEAYHAHVASKSNSVQIVGSTSMIPQSVKVSSAKYLSDWLLSSVSGDQTRYKNDSSAQELSGQVYSVMAQDYWSSKWGDTAVVMSGTQVDRTLVAAQLIYQKKAPVFFTGSDGSLSSEDLDSLKSGGFTSIVIAGSESDVSADVASSIASQTGITPTRVLDSGSSAYEASVNFAQQMIDAGSTYGCVAVADGSSSANVTLAAQVAALKNGVVLVCNSSRDVKKAQDYLSGILSSQGSTTVKSLYVVGTFKEIDANAQTRLESIWSTPESTAVTDADSFEVDGSVYAKTGSNTAKLLKASTTGSSAITVNSVTFDGTVYKVTAIGSGAFGSNVTSATIGTNVKTVASDAFKYCWRLAKLDVKSKSFTKIGAIMFAGMTNLASASFAGNVASIGKNAFNGCKALKTLTIKSTKLGAGKIGAKAFTGTPAKITVKVPKAKLKAYKTAFIKKGLSKKAKFTKC